MPDAVARREPAITFLAEQDGAVERELKSKLSELFLSERAVQRAYLVRVRYADAASITVALALLAAPQSKDTLVSAIGDVFRLMFGVGQHLDILFASPAQGAKISMVCRSFFQLA
jgi:hypothetical protein